MMMEEANEDILFSAYTYPFVAGGLVFDVVASCVLLTIAIFAMAEGGFVVTALLMCTMGYFVLDTVKRFANRKQHEFSVVCTSARIRVGYAGREVSLAFDDCSSVQVGSGVDSDLIFFALKDGSRFEMSMLSLEREDLARFIEFLKCSPVRFEDWRGM